MLAFMGEKGWLVAWAEWSEAGDPEVTAGSLHESSSWPVTLLLSQLQVSDSSCQQMICDFV